MVHSLIQLVLVIWSFIPVLAYLLAKSIGAQGQANKVTLFISGVVIALVEHGFSYFNLLTDKQHDISTAIVFLLFFLVAYLPLHKQQTADL